MSKARIVFDIYCFDRQLVIDVDVNHAEEANNILKERYDTWNQYGDAQCQCQCCEEYMLEGLDDKNIKYTESELT